MEHKQQCGTDLRLELTITPEEATGGCQKEIVVLRYERCKACDGKSQDPTTSCEQCHGDGRIQANRRIALSIPAGIKDGMKIRLTGAGNAGTSGSTPGNLYIALSVKQDKTPAPEKQSPSRTSGAAPISAQGGRIGMTYRKEEVVPTTWEVGDIILGEFEVTGTLGRGGMGVVHKVHFYGSNSDLAVKSPRQEMFTREGGKENFIREAETWMRLGRHAHIVSCHFVRLLGGIPRVFAEYVDGGSLVEAIRTRRLYLGGHDQVLERILDLAIQFAWGLHAAHEQGLVHQDVKPANVMLTREGVAKITDFGLAKARTLAGEGELAEAGQSILVTSGGMTPAYCSPEQNAGQPLSRKTDIWSWGVSMLEMFAGSVMWATGAMAQEALASHHREHEAIPPMPPAVVTLLKHCFQPRPEDRPTTMLEVADELRTIYENLLGRPYTRQVADSPEKQIDRDMIPSLAAFGRPQEALATASQAIQRDLDNASLYMEKGLVLKESGRPQEALQAVEQAIRLEPGVAHYHYNLGNVLENLNQYHAALLAYGRASRLDPSVAYYYYKQGNVLLFLGMINPNRLPDALEFFERATRLNPRLGIAYQKKGQILNHIGRPAEALRAFEQAILADPRNAESYQGKGLALEILRRQQEADEAFEQAKRVGRR